MDNSALGVTLISTIVLLVAFIFSYFYPLPNFFENAPFTATAIVTFISGVIYFGYFAFVPIIFFGLQMGAEKNAAIFLYILPTIIATYAGTKLGFALQRDFLNKENFLEQGKTILFLFMVAIFMAIVIELTLPSIISYWPKDFFGLNMSEGKNSISLIQKLTTMIRK